MNYIIAGKGVLSHLLSDVVELANTTLLSQEEILESSLSFSQNDRLYVPSEISLHAVLQHMQSSPQKKAVEVLKDKYTFRKVMQPLFSDFFFTKMPLEHLKDFKPSSGKSYIVKPVKGFFSYGIRAIDKDSSMTAIAHDLAKELSHSSQYFSPHVISSSDMLIEEFIPGDEYAVDMYYNSQGQPTIMNIYYHPIPKFKAYFNVLYYSDKKTFDLLYQPLISFFTTLQKTLRVTSFPIHAEFRLRKDRLVPIELNPLRFGGMGLADLADYAYDFNPFKAFFTDFSPNWERIWEEKKGKHFAWVLGYDGIGMNMHAFRPDHEKFKQDIGKILHYDTIDYRHNPVFASAYVQLDKIHLEKILEMDFTNYFIHLK